MTSFGSIVCFTVPFLESSIMMLEAIGQANNRTDYMHKLTSKHKDHDSVKTNRY